jgi:hypothetical protein
MKRFMSPYTYPILRLSNLFFAMLLVIISWLIPDQVLAFPLAITWTVVALICFVLANAVRRRAGKRRAEVLHSHPDNEGLRLLTAMNHIIAWLVEYIHTTFVGVGVVSIVMPDDSYLRLVLARDGILLAQYMLFLIIAFTYWTNRKVEAIVERELKEKN